MQLPVSREALGREIEQGVAQAANAESLVRVIVSRGSGPLGLDPELALETLRVVLVEPLELPPARSYREGIGVACVQTVRASDAAHSAKLNNYLASALALRAARRQGAEEALVVGRDGFVVEGTTSNVFAVRSVADDRGAIVFTPPLEAGVLPGITRALLLRLAAELGLEVRLEAMRPAELALLDEVFLSSSVREVMPVVRVDGVTVGRGVPGPTTRRLHRALRVAVGLGAEPMPWDRS
jgi:branched-chain amino acid aminotransferase